MANKCWGTCHYWQPESEPDGGDSYCMWTPSPLPFWAHITSGDHEDYVTASQGKKCPVWTQKEQP